LFLDFDSKENFYGAVFGAGTMIGAFATHLFLIGIIVNNDYETLFILAIITFICCLVLIFNQIHQIHNLC
jgi:hypothetical protein